MPDEGKRIVSPDDVETQVFPWGTLKWLSEPRVTNAQNFSTGIVLLSPGQGHTRHNHPGVEEILYVVSGEGIQMVEDGAGEPIRTKISAGMLVHIPADIYHETINTGWEALKLVAVYAPAGPEAFLRSLPDCVIVPAGQIPRS